MDFEETRQLAHLGFDERTETFFVRPRPAQRLTLTRQSLARLVEMYNSIHQGLPLALMEEREVLRLEEIRRRQSAMLRELQQELERREESGLLSRWRRLARRLRPRPGSDA